MSDDDRLADYIRRIEGDDSPRVLPDGCGSCGQSVVSCNCSKYIERAACCLSCSH